MMNNLETVLGQLNEEQKQAVMHPAEPLLILAGAGTGKTQTLTARLAYRLIAKTLPRSGLAVTFTNKAAGELKKRLEHLVGYVFPPAWKPFRLEAGSQQAVLEVGTFHSLAARFLRALAPHLDFQANFSIYDMGDAEKICKQLLYNVPEHTKKRYHLTAKKVLYDISHYKNELVKPLQAMSEASEELEKIIAELYQKYQKALSEAGAFDFDDLITRLVWILEERPEILKILHDNYGTIFVDEYQDVNTAQYILTKLLAQETNDITVVGDDWQAIYAFRGADYRNLLAFKRDWPQATVLTLTKNYRSPQAVLSAAHGVMQPVTERSDKNLSATKKETTLVKMVTVPEAEIEASFIVRDIIEGRSEMRDERREMRDERSEKRVARSEEIKYIPDEQGLESNGFPIGSGMTSKDEMRGRSILDRVLNSGRSNLANVMAGDYDFSRKLGSRNLPHYYAGQKVAKNLTECAILYRTNAQSRTIEEAFLKAGLPYKVVGGIRFYERMEVKDLLSFLRVLVSPKDIISLERAFLLLGKGLGTSSWAVLQNEAEKKEQPLGDFIFQDNAVAVLKPKPASALFLCQKKFESWSEKITSLRPSEIVRLILQESGLLDLYNDGTEEGEGRIENMKEVVNLAQKFDGALGFVGLEIMLQEVALLTEAETEVGANGVTLLTMHAAKGLEFDYVYVVGVEEGLIPHGNSLNSLAEMNEERRLFYVAMTRAKKQLTLLRAQMRTIYGRTLPTIPSRFMDDLPSETLEEEEIF